jgi:hypothetical protein
MRFTALHASTSIHLQGRSGYETTLFRSQIPRCIGNIHRLAQSFHWQGVFHLALSLAGIFARKCDLQCESPSVLTSTCL